MAVTPPAPLHAVPLLLLLPATVSAVLCFMCTDTDRVPCFHDTCNGDACTTTAVYPFWEQVSVDLEEPKSKATRSLEVSRGCVNGTLLNLDKIIDGECNQHTQTDKTIVKNCFCKKKRCNKNHVKAVKHEETLYSTCKCTKNGKQKCSTEGTCRGEWCTVVETKGSLIYGCVNAATTLLGHGMKKAVMRPPLITSLNVKDFDPQHIFNSKSFICADPGKGPKHAKLCNDVPEIPTPDTELLDMQSCPLKYIMNLGTKLAGTNGMINFGDQSCTGHYCWNVTVAPRNQKTYGLKRYESAGCMSLFEKTRLGEQLNEGGGCMISELEDVISTSCFLPPPKPTPATDMKEPKTDVATSPTTGRTEGGEKATKKPKQGRKKQKGRRKATNVPPPPPDKEKEAEDDEEAANTTIVVVFAIILVLIVVAGLVWKFEIHKKLFRARYESVAG